MKKQELSSIHSQGEKGLKTVVNHNKNIKKTNIINKGFTSYFSP